MPRIRADSIEEHRALTRRLILEAAAGLFLEHGYAETTVGEIAAAVGMGRTTLYEYFPDKEEVLVSLVEESLPATVDGIVDAIPNDITPTERLAELVLGHLTFVADEANLGTLLMREGAALSAEAQARVRKAHRRLEGSIRHAYAEGVSAGELKDVPIEQAAELVNALVMGAARYLINRPDPKGELHGLADEVLGLLLTGLAIR